VAEAAALAREGHPQLVAAVAAGCPHEALREVAADVCVRICVVLDDRKRDRVHASASTASWAKGGRSR